MVAVQMTNLNILVCITVDKGLHANRTRIVMLPLFPCHILQLVLSDIFNEEHVVFLVANIYTHHPLLVLPDPFLLILLVCLILQPYEVIVENPCVQMVLLGNYLQVPRVCPGVLLFYLVGV